jgi:hypothetical protein
VGRALPRAEGPARQTVLHFIYRDGNPDRRYWWLILDSTGADLCFSDPGLRVDLTIRSDIRSMNYVWMGLRPLDEAVRAGHVTIDGDREVRREFVRWFPLNYFAGVPRAAPAARGVSA